ncbi:hypothetical protein Tco_0210541 [Tanacetum coccineum]
MKGAIGLKGWFEKMESVFRIYICAKNYQVKYAMCTLLDGALNWWNSYVKTIELDAAYGRTWEELKKMMTGEYWTHKRHSGKSECFKSDQDLGSNPHGTRFNGLSGKSQGRKDADNKRKWEDEQGGNPYQQQTKRREVVRAYVVGSCDKKGYDGTLPLCDRCNLHHYHGPCPA